MISNDMISGEEPEEGSPVENRSDISANPGIISFMVSIVFENAAELLNLFLFLFITVRKKLFTERGKITGNVRSSAAAERMRILVVIMDRILQLKKFNINSHGFLRLIVQTGKKDLKHGNMIRAE